MSFKRKLFDLATALLRLMIRLFGKKNQAKLASHLVEQLVPTVGTQTKHGEIRFYCPGGLLAWRAETLLTKEPETLEWIDGFDQGSVIWDIGANVGVYTLYAAKAGRGKILSFEPSAANYYLLNKNVEVNRLDDRVQAYCLAFSHERRLDQLYMPSTVLGGALNSFSESVDWKGKSFEASFQQGMIGLSVDEFIQLFDPPFPNHIKLDVDGLEDKIVLGATQTLADPRVRSVLVELDTDREEYCRGVIDVMERSGLKLVARKHAEMFDQGEFAASYNHIFVRQGV